MKILFLTQWYPHRYDAMAGLFVRKHAAAVARQGHDVCVLYFHPDGQVRGTEIIEQQTDDITEIYVYHSCSTGKAMRKGYQVLLQNWGLPDVCQVNVLSKNAIFARYLQLRHHVPYILLEHWTGYLSANGAYMQNSKIKRIIMEHLAAHASCIMPVSRLLIRSMQDCGIHNKQWLTMRNVVDDFFFTPAEPQAPHTTFQWLHVSCFSEKAKNICGILRAFKTLSMQHQNIRLDIIGTGQDYEADKHLADELGLTDTVVFFHGEQTPEQVHQAMLKADAFVLFSRYENAPVVLSECLAVGLPIVTSNVGGIADMVDKKAGLLVPSEDEQALTEALSYMMEHLEQFNKKEIQKLGQVYTYEAVGRQLSDIYASVRS